MPAKMKRLLSLLLLVLLLALPLSARTKFLGYAERGGQTALTALTGTSTKVQRSYPLCPIQVYVDGTTTPATIYSNSTGTVIPSGLLTSDTAGYFQFWGDSATYSVKYSPPSSTPWTISGFGGGGGGQTLLAPAPSGGDDYATLQTLLNSAINSGIPLQLQRGIYLVSAELQVNVLNLAYSKGLPAIIRGVPSAYDITPTPNGTVIRETTLGQRSVLANLTDDTVIEDLWLDANDKATYGLYMNNSAFSTYKRVMCEHAVIDGWHHNTDTGTSYFEQIKGQYNGRTYLTAGISGQYGARTTVITGTATITSGSATIPIAAGTDLTTLGIRKNDLIRVGAAAATSFYGAIESVTANTVTLQANSANLPTATLAGQNFAIGVGDGFHEIATSNDNVNTLVSLFMRGNGGCGFGLHYSTTYGDTVIGSQSDFNNFFSFSIGASDNLTLVFGAAIIRPYTEADVAGSMWIGSGAVDVTIVSPVLSSLPEFRGSFLGGGSVSVLRGGSIESLQNGAQQNFLFEITNVAGTLKHNFLSDHFVPSGTDSANKINGATGALTPTPLVSNVVGFAAGAGILAATPEYLIFDTPDAQAGKPQLQVSVEFNSTGVVYLPAVEPITTNINGTTIVRYMLRLTNPTTGAFYQWNTTNIPAGTTLSIRVAGLLR